jgi:hypothetical protein
MKILVSFCVITLAAVLYLSCTRTAPESPDAMNGNGCTAQIPDMHVTYDNYVRGVLTTYCTPSCHNGGSLAPGDFRTYQGVRPYLSQFYYRVIQDRADMPQGNAPLPKSIRDSLNAWIKNCAPEQ